MTKSHSKNESKTSKCFDIQDFKQALERQFGKQNAEFFAMALHEQAGNMLEQSSRFSKLVEWCEKEIKQAGEIVNVFSPADKTAAYTQAQAKVWREQIHFIAELVYFYNLLVDSRTTTAQRENIEYTIGKLYGVRYNDYLGAYV